MACPRPLQQGTGERKVKKCLNQPQAYQDVFGHTLVEMAKENSSIVGITPAMPTGCSMIYLMKEMPERAFDVGIAEAHAVTYSAGMAKEGMIPFCNIYSSFMQRAYDQVIHDVALQKLKVIMCLDRAGLVARRSHTPCVSTGYLRPIPNLVISAPYNEHELRNLHTAVYGNDGPFVIRYPRGQGQLAEWQNKPEILPIGKGRKLSEGTMGHCYPSVPLATTAPRQSRWQEKRHQPGPLRYGIPQTNRRGVVARGCFPLPLVITLENGTVNGGLEVLSPSSSQTTLHKRPVAQNQDPDTFITHGSISELQQIAGIDVEGILRQIESFGLTISDSHIPTESGYSHLVD